MAHISESCGKFRVQIERLGTRKSKTFDSREAAEAWVKSTEPRLVERIKKRNALNAATLVSELPRRALEAMAGIDHTGDEIARGAIPMPITSGIYFLVKNGEVAYVGQSLDVLHRIARHRREGRSFDSYNYMLCSVDDLDEMESRYIAALMPAQNWSFGNKWTPKRPDGITIAAD